MDRLLYRLMRFHQWLYEHTDGRVGHRLLPVPTLLLRTTGRRTGQVRTSALVYAADDGAYCVVPSNGGDDRPPAWLLNLEAHPEVGVQVARHRMPARATVVHRDHPDFERLWAQLDELNRGRYGDYQARTGRPIPVVRLEPTLPAL